MLSAYRPSSKLDATDNSNAQSRQHVGAPAPKLELRGKTRIFPPAATSLRAMLVTGNRTVPHSARTTALLHHGH
jgi:hypothetical protein